MGCGQTKESSGSQLFCWTSDHDTRPGQVPVVTKELEAIKKNDSFLVKNALSSINPLDDVSTTLEGFTYLHAAAQSMQ